MSRLANFYRSTLGKKVAVAATGVILFGFVVAHMAGNLKVFTGVADDGTPHIDEYAAFLRTMGEPLLPHALALWAARIVLLAALVIHVTAVLQLTRLNRSARPVAYTRHTLSASSLSARTMFVSGLLILGFVVVHILHFTTGTIEVAPFAHGTVYANLYHSFRLWVVVLLYVGAMAVLALHLYHGVWSLFQTLGLDNPDRNRGLRMLAVVAAVLLFIGFCSVPVLFGLGALSEPSLDQAALIAQSKEAP